MIRTQIQLPEKEHQALRETAQRLHRSMADCIREAIGLFLKREDNVGADFEAVAGRFRPVSTEDLKDHDRDWVDAIR